MEIAALDEAAGAPLEREVGEAGGVLELHLVPSAALEEITEGHYGREEYE